MVLCQNRLIRSFRKARATTPESAIAPREVGCGEIWIFRHMARQGVFAEAGEGRYYLDETVTAQFLARRNKRLAVGGSVILVLVAWVFWLSG